MDKGIDESSAISGGKQRLSVDHPEQVSWDQFEKNMGRELTVMYHWFEEKGFHFNIEEVRREYPPTHTFD